MIHVKKEGILLQKTSLGFENDGVLNPGVIKSDGVIHLFYRAVSKGNFSSIGYCTLSDPLTVATRSDVPVLFPQYSYESQGIEDVRVTKIEDLYYFSYCAYDGINALGALAISEDLKHFKKQGIITPQVSFTEFRRLAETKEIINEKYARYNNPGPIKEGVTRQVLLWDKNVVFFPKKIAGKFHFLHRIKPDIQIVAVTDLSELNEEFWQHYFLNLNDWIALKPRFPHEVSYIGGGCPPIETEYGWLLIYHGVHDTVKGYVYTACAALLDLQQPQKELSRLPYPLFTPQESWEVNGEVNNVCFPTGAILDQDTLYIYYGAADEQIATASLSFSALIQELLKYKTENEK